MRTTLAAATGTALALSLAACGCSGGRASNAAPAPTDPSQVSGTITVLTNRTDQVQDGTLDGYAKRFNEIYPHVTVKFQGLTDYEGDVKIRMSSSDYGDVLSIPNSVPLKQYPVFFASLGPAADLSRTYDFTDHATVNGQVYGIANIGTANGFVYNKAVWKQSGATDWPTTPQQFLDDLQAVKAKTGATPYYTNYHDGWPLTNWGNALGTPSLSLAAGSQLGVPSALPQLVTNYHDGWPLTNWGNALGTPSCDPAANDKLADTDR